MSRLGSTVPLVARADEVGRLRVALAAADRGDAGVVLIGGDAGVGKSRLVQEVAHQAESGGALVLTGRCLDTGEDGMPYLPFAEALAQLAAAEPAMVARRPALAPLAPDLELPEAPRRSPVPLPPGVRGGSVEQDIGQLQLFDAVLGVLTEAARERTVLFAVEDLHWAAPSTLTLLSYLLARLRAQRMLVLATYRTDELHRRHPLRPLLAELLRGPAVQRLDLGPLSSVDSQALVRALLADGDAGAPADLLAGIAERSEGNAFFAEELVAAAGDRDDQLPWTLVEVLLSRVERMSPATQEVLRLAATGGRWVRHARLQAVAAAAGIEATELDAALREAVGHHLLVVDGQRYSFRHALLKEAVYGDMLPGERARTHGRYADVIGTEHGKGTAAALAHHSQQAGSLSTALAASLTAGDEAERLGAPSDALHQVERALSLWDAVPAAERPNGATEVGLLMSASSLCAATARPDRAVSYARSAVRAAEDAADAADATATARAWLRLAQALDVFDETDAEALQAIDNAWNLLRDGPPSAVKAKLLARRAVVLRATDVEQAGTDVAAALAEADAAGSAAARAEALVTRGMLLGRAGDTEQSRASLREAIRLAAETGALNTELRGRFHLGFKHFDGGELDTAVEEFQRTLQRAREVGMADSVYGVESRTLLAVAYYLVGDWDGNAEVAATAQDGTFQRGAAGVVLGRLDAVRLPVLVGRGRFAEADRMVEGLRSRWHLDWQIPMWAATSAAEAHNWRGDYHRALDAVQELLDHFAAEDAALHVVGIRAAATGLAACANAAAAGADWAADRGKALREHAIRVVEHGSVKGASLGPEGQAWLAVVAAEYARLTGAPQVDAWQAAVTAFDHGERYPQAICRWRLAAALLDAGERDRAGAELRATLGVAERLGAEPLHAALLALARRAGLATADTQHRGGGPLTERERSVLGLVALGRTNRQVGAELYISEKTVSVHLSRAMAKLGAARRAEAVAVAYDRGLL